jgi:hypothetical protein
VDPQRESALAPSLRGWRQLRCGKGKALSAVTESTHKLAADAVAIATDMLKDGNKLMPLLIVELNGLRDVEHFEPDALQEARTKALRLSRLWMPDQVCALVYEGRVRMNQRAILVEVQRAGQEEVEVFSQPFRRKAGRFRPFKLIGEVTLAGRREALI